jgi:hypothetical protein
LRAISLARKLSLPYDLCEALELRAELLLRQEQFADALAACLEARELAERIEEREVAEQACMLELRLRAAIGELSAEAACAKLGALLDTAPNDAMRAPIWMAIWQIDPLRVDARAAAAAIYRERYAAAPSAETRRRYRALLGEDLPPPPPLPPLPEALLGTPAPLASLLARAGVV